MIAFHGLHLIIASTVLYVLLIHEGIVLGGMLIRCHDTTVAIVDDYKRALDFFPVFSHGYRETVRMKSVVVC